jgi:hypothetical protein
MSTNGKAQKVDSTSQQLLKPVVIAGYAYLLNKYMLNENDMTRNLYFAGSVGADVALAQIIADTILLPTDLLPNNNLLIGKTQAIEILTGAGFSCIINRYVGSGRFLSNSEFMKKVYLVAMIDK